MPDLYFPPLEDVLAGRAVPSIPEPPRPSLPALNELPPAPDNYKAIGDLAEQQFLSGNRSPQALRWFERDITATNPGLKPVVSGNKVWRDEYAKVMREFDDKQDLRQLAEDFANHSGPVTAQSDLGGRMLAIQDPKNREFFQYILAKLGQARTAEREKLGTVDRNLSNMTEGFARGLGDVTASVGGAVRNLAEGGPLVRGAMSALGLPSPEQMFDASGLTTKKTDLDFLQQARNAYNGAFELKGNLLERGLVGAMQSAPLMLATAIPVAGPALGGSLMYAQAQQGQRQNALARGASSETADTVSEALAPLEAGLEYAGTKVGLGVFKGAAAAPAKAAVSFLEELGTEVAQDEVQNLSGALAQRFGTDNPVDWWKEFTEPLKNLPQTAVTVGLMQGAGHLASIGAIHDGILERREMSRRDTEKLRAAHAAAGIPLEVKLDTKAERDKYVKDLEAAREQPQVNIEGQAQAEQQAMAQQAVDAEPVVQPAEPIATPKVAAATSEVAPPAPKPIPLAAVKQAHVGREVTETDTGYRVKLAKDKYLDIGFGTLEPNKAQAEKQLGRTFTDAEWEGGEKQAWTAHGQFDPNGTTITTQDGTKATLYKITLSERDMKAGTLTHEQVHLMKELGVITPSEWGKLVEKHAKGIADPVLVEEAVADAAAAWTPKKVGAMTALVNRLLKMVGIDREAADRILGEVATGKPLERLQRGDANAQTDTNIEGQPTVEARYSQERRKEGETELERRARLERNFLDKVEKGNKQREKRERDALLVLAKRDGKVRVTELDKNERSALLVLERSGAVETWHEGGNINAIPPYVGERFVAITEEGQRRLNEMGQADTKYSQTRRDAPLSGRTANEDERPIYRDAQKERKYARLPEVRAQAQVREEAVAAIAKNHEGEYARLMALEKLPEKDVRASDLDQAIIVELIHKYHVEGDQTRARQLALLDTLVVSPATGRSLAMRRDPMHEAKVTAKGIRSAELAIEHAERDIANGNNVEEAKVKLGEAQEALAAAKAMHQHLLGQSIERAIYDLRDADVDAIKKLDKQIADANSRHEPTTSYEKKKSNILTQHEATVDRITTALMANDIDIGNMEETAADPRKAFAALRTISSERATLWDVVMEYWYASILSGFATNVRNVLGNAAHIGIEAGLSRTFESLGNMKGENKNIAQFREWGTIGKRFNKAYTRALANMKLAWDTEAMVSGATGGINPEGTGPQTAISGKKGRVVRVPLRLLTAGDAFFSSLVSEIDVHIKAERIAAATELKEGTREFQARVDELLEDLDGPAWREAVDTAQRATFRQHPTAGSVAEKATNVGKAIQAIPVVGRFAVPFVPTPVNIVRTAYGLSPLALPQTLFETYQARKSGDPAALRNVQRQWARMGAGGIAMFAMLMTNDPEEPWITGAAEDTKELRDAARAAGRPPNSLYIPGMGWWYYGGVEPVASVLAAIADLSRAIRRGESVGEYIGSLIQQANNKTFLKGTADMLEIATGKESGGKKMAYMTADLLASFVPNLIRGTVGATKEDVSDRRILTERGQMLPTMLNRAVNKTELAWGESPRLDQYGRPIKKGSGPGGYAGFLFRLAGQSFDQGREMLPADRIITRWNDSHDPEQRLSVSPPDRSYTRDGKIVDMTDAQYQQYAKASGEALKGILTAEISESEEATQQHIDMVRNAMADSRRIVLDQLVKQWKAGETGSVDPEAIAKQAVDNDLTTQLDHLTRERPKMQRTGGSRKQRVEKFKKSLANWKENRDKAQGFIGKMKYGKAVLVSRYGQSLRKRGERGETLAKKIRRARALLK